MSDATGDVPEKADEAAWRSIPTKQSIRRFSVSGTGGPRRLLGNDGASAQAAEVAKAAKSLCCISWPL